MSQKARAGEGVLYAGAAYTAWGLFPLYFILLKAVPASEILVHRIVWGAVFAFALAAWLGQGAAIWRAFGSGRAMRVMAVSTAMIGINWYLYIWAVTNARVMEAALGYYINPLVNVLLGVLILGERLRRWQWIAVGVAATGVLNQSLMVGTFPWIALTLAVTFGLYGLVRKTAPVDSLQGMAIETALLGPFALAWLLWIEADGTAQFLNTGLATDILLVVSGPITVGVLLLFAMGARRLQMATLGMLQYIAPTLQALSGLLIVGEPFSAGQAVTFALILMALAILTADTIARHR